MQQLAIVTGLGLAVTGIALMLQVAESKAGTWATRGAGLVCILIGVLMALWPDSGAPWLARLVAAGLILHGLFAAVTAIRGGKDHRSASLLIALAGICLGAVSFSWPVLTLALFRLGVGAWLIFTGVRTLLGTWRARPARRTSIVGTWARTTAAAIALLLAVTVAYGSAQLFAGSPLPAPDDFYEKPDNVPAAPGQLIRTEPLLVGVPAGAQAWKMLYTTTHPDGSPAISSGTILAPAERNDTALPLLTVAHGTTGVSDGCAPSLSATPFADGAATAMAEMVTSHGWVAVTSDYTGMGTVGTAAYLVGEAEARNVLDASLAAQQFQELRVATDTVVWGHSQGGQGALWTGQLAESYAPTLQVRGIGAFAPAADLYGLADADKNTAPGKTVSAYIATTWNELYPDLELRQQLTPGSAAPVARISQYCFNGSDALSAILTGTQVPNQVFPEKLLEGAFGDKLKAQTPTGPFAAPVLVAQGLADPLVLPSLQEKWVSGRCAAGIAIDFRTFEGLSHVSLVAADSAFTPQLVEWTLDRWAGKPGPSSCVSQQFPEE